MAVIVEMTLASSTYATMALREAMKIGKSNFCFKFSPLDGDHLIVSWICVSQAQIITKCAKKILSKIAKAINETFTRLEYMLQAFVIYFLGNPCFKDIVSGT